MIFIGPKIDPRPGSRPTSPADTSGRVVMNRGKCPIRGAMAAVFRFRLRTLLLFVAFLCMLIGWRSHRIDLRHRAVEHVEKFGGEVIYESRLSGLTPWLYPWLVDEQVHSVELDRSRFTDADLQLLEALQEIEHLDLTGTEITDQGLRTVAELGELESLSLRDTLITSSGLSHLVGLEALRLLDLRGTAVSETSIDYLRKLPQLQSLELEGTDFTDEGTVDLRRSMPQVRVCRLARDLVLWLNSPYPKGELANETFESVEALRKIVGVPDHVIGEIHQEWRYDASVGRETREVVLQVVQDPKTSRARLMTPYYASQSAVKDAIGLPHSTIGRGELVVYRYSLRGGVAYVSVYAPARGGAFVVNAKGTPHYAARY